MVARQAEEERRPAEEAEAVRPGSGSAKPPEERIAGRLQFWVAGPAGEAAGAHGDGDRRPRAELLAELAAAP